MSFRTTFRGPIACVLPSLTLSQQHTAAVNPDPSDQTIALWRDVNLLPAFDPDNVTPVASRVVLLPGLLDDPRRFELNQRAFHLIVEHCTSDVFGIEAIKMTVDFKWNANARKILLAHLGGYSMSLVLATVAMVASTQSGRTAWIDGLQAAVCVCETIALGNEAMQMRRQGRQYLDGGGWNVIDVATSVCLLAAAVAHFSDDHPTVKTFGAIGVATKWFGRKRPPHCMQQSHY